jgi:hypothetical protein
MNRLNVNQARCEALFASGLQRSDTVTASVLTEVISRTVRQFGHRGCVSLMAQEFGDHPEPAAERMRWIRQLTDEAFASSTVRRAARGTRAPTARSLPAAHADGSELRAACRPVVLARRGTRSPRLLPMARREPQPVTRRAAHDDFVHQLSRPPAADQVLEPLSRVRAASAATAYTAPSDPSCMTSHSGPYSHDRKAMWSQPLSLSPDRAAHGRGSRFISAGPGAAGTSGPHRR